MTSGWIVVIVAQWIVIILLCLISVGVLRYLAIFRERMELASPPTTGKSIGEKLPDLELQELVTSRTFAIPRDRPCLLAFVSLTCGSCGELLRQIDALVASPRRELAVDLAIVVIADDPAEFLSPWQRLAASSDVHVYVVRDVNMSAPSKLGLWALPTAVLIDSHGRISDQTANPHVAGWLYRALKEETPSQTSKPEMVPVSMPAWMDPPDQSSLK